MTLFLTSSPSGCPFELGPAIPVLDRRNHFLENLRAEQGADLFLIAGVAGHKFGQGQVVISDQQPQRLPL